jgi:hypothetical protein
VRFEGPESLKSDVWGLESEVSLKWGAGVGVRGLGSQNPGRAYFNPLSLGPWVGGIQPGQLAARRSYSYLLRSSDFSRKSQRPPDEAGVGGCTCFSTSVTAFIARCHGVAPPHGSAGNCPHGHGAAPPERPSEIHNPHRTTPAAGPRCPGGVHGVRASAVWSSELGARRRKKHQ